MRILHQENRRVLLLDIDVKSSPAGVDRVNWHVHGERTSSAVLEYDAGAIHEVPIREIDPPFPINSTVEEAAIAELRVVDSLIVIFTVG